MRIAYVLKRYPRLSETFIVQEILQMEERGADLGLFAIMDPREPLQNPSVQRVRAPVRYVQRSFDEDLPIMLRSHRRLLRRHPVGYARAVGHLLRGTRSPASLRTFVQAGHLADLAERERVGHLHAHFANNPASLASYASVITGIPFSFTAHAKDLYLSRPGSILNKAERATFVATCTAFNQRYLQGILPPVLHQKVHVVYHGVDTDRFRPPEAREHAPVPRILSVGRLVPKKGYGPLIEAARLLRDRGVAFRLDIYGGGDLRDVLAHQVRQADLEGTVVLHGACTQDELAERYQQSDVFALSPVVMENGDRDGIPNVLLEAMASGLPVVSTNISGIPELIQNGCNGLLVEPGNPAALADALASLLLDPALRDRLGRDARDSVVREFDAGRNVGKLASLFQDGQTRPLGRERARDPVVGRVNEGLRTRG